MARFYGWTNNEIESLDCVDFAAYLEAITVLEAQEILLQMRIQDHPHQDESARRSFHRDVWRKAYPNQETVSSEKAADILRTVFNGR
jgi:hypothetical protein